MSAVKTYVVMLFFIAACVPSGQAQQLTVANAELSDREKDGFSGAVRRVKVESARITVKEGKPVEGERVVRAITTYDMKGRRIDTVAHPVQGNTPAGREQYRYDAKGNIVEMTLRGNDGSILSREKYEYEFDEIGNWKKMISSIVTYENGKIALEPIEVTYRTLTYYYNQTIERVVQSSQSKRTAPKPEVPSVATNQLSAGNSTPSAEIVTQPEKTRGDQAEGVTTGNSVGSNSSLSTASEPVTVKRVSEEVLKAAAIKLPAAEMPLIGQLQTMFRREKVQVVVDEKGDVVSARAAGGATVFTEAAEAAAHKAKFSPEKLSETPARVFGVITYDFSTEIAEPALPPSTASTGTPKVALGEDAPPMPRAIPVAAPAEKLEPFAQGVSHLNKHEYVQAEEIFKALVYRNPEDAKGYQHLAFSYFGQQKYLEAIAAFKLALKLGPQLADARTYYLLGASYHRLKKYSEAVKALQQGIYVLRAARVEAESTPIQGQPTLLQFHYNLGVLYQTMGANFEAIKSFQKAAALDPKAGEPHFGMALTYLGMGDRASVEREQGILRKLNPDLAKKVGEALAGRTLYIPPGCMALPCP